MGQWGWDSQYSRQKPLAVQGVLELPCEGHRESGQFPSSICRYLSVGRKTGPWMEGCGYGMHVSQPLSSESSSTWPGVGAAWELGGRGVVTSRAPEVGRGQAKTPTWPSWDTSGMKT